MTPYDPITRDVMEELQLAIWRRRRAKKMLKRADHALHRLKVLLRTLG